MAESLSYPSVEPPDKPEDVARRDFPVTRRGYDQMQVRAYLTAVASTLRMANTREAELRSRLASAVKRAHQAEKLDEATLTRRLGEETVRVLDTAREAAASIVANAEDRAGTIVSDAEERAAQVEETAAGVMAQRTAEAEEAAAQIRARAEEALQLARERATELVDEGRREGDEMVAEARIAREHILRDMDRRRRVARAQIEQMKAGRDRLLDAFGVVQTRVDEATGKLTTSLRDAKIAADAAARRVQDSREPGIIELEAEIEAARVAGLIPTDVEAPPADAAPPVAVPEDPMDPPPDAATDEAEAAEPVLYGPPSPQDPVADAADSGLYEPRPVELDPRERAGRKLKRQPVAPSDVSPSDLQTVAVGDPVETVSVVPADEPEPEPVAEVEEPEPEPEPVAEVEEPEPEPESVAEVEEPEPEPESEPSPSAGDETAVDDLFARIRRDREQAVGAAHATLATDEGGDDGAEAPGGIEVIETVERRIKRVLSEDQNRVLDAVRRNGDRRGGPVPLTLEDVLVDADGQVDGYIEAVRDHLGGGRITGPASGRLASIVRRDLVDPLREAIEDCLDGETEAMLAELRNRFRRARTEWVSPVAEHLVARADELSRLDDES